MRGDADVTMYDFNVIGPLLEANEINLLISFTDHRIEPNTPTTMEKGFPNIHKNVGGLGGRIVIGPPKLDPEANGL